jgi:putative flippase GtrA
MSVLSHSSNLIEGVVPSYYMSVMGYMFSFVATQGLIFKDELSMRPTTAYWLRIFTIMTFIMVAGLGCIRVATNCEPWWAAIISLIFGIIVGLIFVFVIVTTFGRRIVNALHLPLLEKRIPDEKPIYVCANPSD